VKTAGAPFLAEGKNPSRLQLPSGWGVGGRRCTTSPFPAAPSERFKIKSEHDARTIGRSPTRTSALLHKVAQTSVSRRRQGGGIWRPTGQPYPIRR